MVTAGDRGPEEAGVVRALRLAGRSGEPMRTVESAVAEVDRGFVGDRHATRRPGHRRQLLLVDQAELDLLALPGGVLRENVLLEGIPLESLDTGQRLHLGEEVVLDLTEPCVPCSKLERIRPGLISEVWGHRGQLARVVAGGTVRVGDPVRLGTVNPDAPRPIRPKLP
jgi:MOSC domain-containing protein YiiM